MSESITYIYVLRPVNPERFNTIVPKEEATIKQHFKRLRKVLDEGKLILAGPCLDGAFGIVVFYAQSMEEAEEFMKDDPAVKNGIMTAELHPFRVSLLAKTSS